MSDNVVDARDLNALAVNWRRSAQVTSGASVPEPSGLFLVVAAHAAVFMLSGRARLGRRKSPH